MKGFITAAKGFVYDCEVLRVPGGEPESGYLCAEGWRDFDNLGISVIGVAMLGSNEVKCFVNPLWASTLNYPDFGEFQKLVYKCSSKGNKIVGFNSVSFDDLLCFHNGILVNTNYDLLQRIRLSAYGSIEFYDQPKGYSYSLDAIASANGLKKTGHGANAPKQWQNKKYLNVIQYCINDAIVTRDLMVRYEKGQLVDPNNGNILKPINTSF